MGLDRLAIAFAAAALLQFCGGDDDAAEDEADVVPSIEGAETVAVDVALPAPAYGGTVVAAGAHPVEVLPYEDGTIDAYVLSPEPPPPAQTQLTVRVPADDGGTHPVLLVWDPSLERYRGTLRRVHPAPGPVEVVVVHDGTRYQGAGPRVVVVGPAPPAPTVVVAAPDSPRVVVERPASNVNVVVERPRPQVNVVVERPQPNVQIHVGAPRPRHEVRVVGPGRHDKGLHLGHRGRGNVRVRGPGPGRGHGGRVRVRAR